MVYHDFGVIETQDYLIYRINEIRNYYALPSFEIDPAYTCAAASWSKRMWRLNICTHQDPETKENFWDRIVLCGGKIYRVAEIVACNVPSIEQAIGEWINNPGHAPFLFSKGGKAGVAVAGNDAETPRWYTLITDY